MGFESASQIGVALISALQGMHERGMIHRDLKPHNIAFHRSRKRRRSSEPEIYIFDMGLCKKFMTSSGHHINYRENKSMCGTPRYASIASHLGCELSRRDDLESVLYTLLYIALGKLPWQGLKSRKDATKDERNHQIARVKIQTPIRQLMRKAPRGWQSCMRMIRKLEFEETPDYDALISLLLRRKGGGETGRTRRPSSADE